MNTKVSLPPPPTPLALTSSSSSYAGLSFDLAFSVEAPDDTPLYPIISDALHAYARHNKNHQGPTDEFVTLDGVNFRVSFRNDYYVNGEIVDMTQTGEASG